VTPRRPFDLKNGGWGAFEFVARYGDLHLDPGAFNRDPTAGGLRFASPIASAQEAREWGVGLNWYLNRTSSSFSITNKRPSMAERGLRQRSPIA